MGKTIRSQFAADKNDDSFKGERKNKRKQDNKKERRQSKKDVRNYKWG